MFWCADDWRGLQIDDPNVGFHGDDAGVNGHRKIECGVTETHDAPLVCCRYRPQCPTSTRLPQLHRLRKRGLSSSRRTTMMRRHADDRPLESSHPSISADVLNSAPEKTAPRGEDPRATTVLLVCGLPDESMSNLLRWLDGSSVTYDRCAARPVRWFTALQHHDRLTMKASAACLSSAGCSTALSG